MADKYELRREALEEHYDFLPDFDNTHEINEFTGLIGQERAEDALKYGLEINRKGFNIFVCGQNSTGKKSFVMKTLQEYGRSGSTIYDWCYVYNFEDEYSPIAIRLQEGKAVLFKESIEHMIERFKERIFEELYSEEYENRKSTITDEYQDRLSEMIDKLNSEAEERGFDVKNTSEGFAFIPLDNGKEMTEKEYNALEPDEKKDINNKAEYLKALALDILKETRLSKKLMNDMLAEMHDEICNEILGKMIDDIINEFGHENEKLIQYMLQMKRDIISNMNVFMDEDEDGDEHFFKRYYVNVMTCSECKKAPVVYEENPEYNNLTGDVKYESKSGNLTTDFTFIQPGSLHKANGGVIVIDALQLILSYQGWNSLKRCLLSERINIDNLKNQLDIIPIKGINPESIPLDVKVVLIGTPEVYYTLYNYDSDFRELFTIKADFDDVIRNDSVSALKILGFISSYCRNNNIKAVTREGIKEILKYSSRFADDRKYFSASIKKIIGLINQADIIAEKQGASLINKSHILQCAAMERERQGLFKNRILEMYRDGKYIAKLSGGCIGEINGLSVMNIGDTVVGKQSRITATTFCGRAGIINIEREADMSGKIHNKGILILSGYLGETFGQKLQPSFSASLCFEQMYNGVDGDSASAAELIAIISSLGDIPIKQSIAITGSVNQKGEIQPVGAINHKVEGYFDICSIFGFDGTHGVIIPKLNEDELILRDDVLDAIEKNRFHIYSVCTIDECFEILWYRNEKEGLKGYDEIKKRVISKLEGYNTALNSSKRR